GSFRISRDSVARDLRCEVDAVVVTFEEELSRLSCGHAKIPYCLSQRPTGQSGMGHYQFRARLPQKGRSVEYVVEASSEEEALRKGAHRACQEHGVDRVELPLVSFLGHSSPAPASPHSGAEQAQMVDATRLKHVDQAREQWIRRLIDLSRRNNLLYYRNLQLGTVDLTQADSEAMAS